MKFFNFIVALYNHLTKSRLRKQVRYYLSFREKNYPSIIEHDREILNKLIKCCDSEYITMKALKNFEKEHVKIYNGNYPKIATLICIRNFLKFLRARGIECPPPECIEEQEIDLNKRPENVKMVFMQKKKLGRPFKIDKINEVKTLKKLGFSYRQIAKSLKCDVKTAYRWDNYESKHIVG